MVRSLWLDVVILAAVGGPGALAEQLRALYGDGPTRELLAFWPTRWDETAWLLCAVLAVQWFAQINADGTGDLAQRSMLYKWLRMGRVAVEPPGQARGSTSSSFDSSRCAGLAHLVPSTALGARQDDPSTRDGRHPERGAPGQLVPSGVEGGRGPSRGVGMSKT